MFKLKSGGRKRLVVWLVSGILLIVLLIILMYFGRHSGQETRSEPVTPPQSTPEPPVSQKPPPPATQTPEQPEPVVPEQTKRSIEELIKDLRDDDIPNNAMTAMYEICARLPDDAETVDALIKALSSDDRQQRLIACFILGNCATHTNLLGNWLFLSVVVDALRGTGDLDGGAYVAEFFLSGQGSEYAKGHLQTALISQDGRQRTLAAFLLSVGMNVHPGNRLRIEAILNDPAADQFIDSHYLQGARAMCAMQAQASEFSYKTPTNLIPDHIYVVKKGDRLSDIAWSYRTDWRLLAIYNCMPNPNLIEPGQEIFIPGTLSVREEDPPASVAEYSPPSVDWNNKSTPAYEHILYPGETLEDVARQYGVSRQDIMKMNKITDPDSVKAGTKLLAPIPE